MPTHNGLFAHLDRHGNAVDLYRTPEDRVVIGTGATTDSSQPAVLCELSYDAVVELQTALAGLLSDPDAVVPDEMELLQWERAMDDRIKRLAAAADVPAGGWEVVIECVIEKLGEQR